MTSLAKRYMGIETEYGIYIEGQGPEASVSASRKLIEIYPAPYASPWNYHHEHPRRDARGFVVAGLSIDPVDARYDAPGTATTDNHLRVDRMLPNGARLYNDHGHPEYATPETRGIVDLIAADKAGERIMQDLAYRAYQDNKTPVRLQKNNTDGNGSSYGTHENYQTLRGLPIQTLIDDLASHFATRILYCGAGKVGCEDTGVSGVDFQISQRADFFKVLASVDTLYNRPLVNTRDEAHDDEVMYRRLHVICGDANLCETATLLKIGTTHLVLRLIEDHVDLSAIHLSDPVSAVKTVSRNPFLLPVLPLVTGNYTTALEVQYFLQRAANQRYRDTDAETNLVLDTWKKALDDYANDPLLLADRVDWVAKYALLHQFSVEEGVPFTADIIRSLDIAYHALDPEEGLYFGLYEAHEVERQVTEQQVLMATEHPPENAVKAIVRGFMARELNHAVVSISWNQILLKLESGAVSGISLDGLGGLDSVTLQDALSDVKTADQFLTCIKRLIQPL